MGGTPNPGRRASFSAAIFLLALAGGLLVAIPGRADDLVTLSGQTFHAVQPVRVEPDGVTWRHTDGIVKVDFSDSPRSVREAYHYDAAKATAYHEARVQAQRQAGEQTRQLLQVNDERQHARAQGQLRAQEAAAPTDPPPGGPTVVYRHGLADTAQAAARSLGEQMDARKAQAAADARNSEGLGNPQLWKYVPGVGSAPKAQKVDLPNSMEFTHSPSGILVPTFGATGDQPAGAFGDDSGRNDFFKPIYMTKSYYEDVDRAAAFARGTPLK